MDRRTGPTMPKYYQVELYVQRLLQTKQWQPGERLPSEHALARQLGVSRLTVRRALAELRRRGLICQEQGRGTFVAGAGGRGHGIGVVVPDLHTGFFLDVVRAVREEAARIRVEARIFSSDGTAAGERAQVQAALGMGLQGLLVVPVGGQDNGVFFSEIVGRGIPVVFLDRFYDGVSADFVGIDDFGGGYLLTSYLLKKGYRRIAFVTREGFEVSSVARRHEGYRAALREAGLTWNEHLSIRDSVAEPDDKSALVRLLTSASVPQAVFCVNDQVADACVRAVQAAGLRVPADVEVVCFTGKPKLDTAPPLTHIRRPVAQMVSVATEHLVSRLRDFPRMPAPFRVLLPVDLVLGPAETKPA